MNIFPIIAIFYSLIVSIKKTKSWLSPSSFFAIFWLFFTITPVIFAPEYNVEINGLWFIALLVMANTSGGLISLTFRRTNSKNFSRYSNLEKITIKNLLIIFNVISLSGMIGLIFYAKYFYLIDVKNFFTLPNLISIDRYSGNLYYPIYIKYALYFIYPGNIIGGIWFCNKNLNFKNKLLCYLSLFLSIILGIIEGSRTSILLGGILFFSSWFATKAILNNGKIKISILKFVTSSFLLIFSFIIFFITIQWLRQGLDPILADFLIIRIKAYFFGYLSAFTIWFETVDNFFYVNNVFTTFAGPLNLIGVLERDLGFYDSTYIFNDISTNIFTAFRSLVTDFSVVGAFMLAFLFGIYFQYLFQKRTEKISGVIPIAMFYSFILYSPLISIFHYNSIFFSWFLVFISLKIIDLQ